MPDLAAARPIRVTRCNWIFSSASNAVRRRIDLLTKQQWAAKAVQNISGPPVEMYNDNASPLSTYRFYMTPDQAYLIETYTWQEFTAPASLFTQIIVPPAYYEFWLYSLAVRCAAPFGVPVPASTADLFKYARAEAQRLNCLAPRIASDDGFYSPHGGLYNWIAGETEDW